MLTVFFVLSFEIGTEYAIKSHLGDILSLIKIGFEHQSWKIRIQAASSLGTVFNKLQSKVEAVYIDDILAILNSAVNVRAWSGKVTLTFLSK